MTRCANALLASGLRPGDRVATLCGNSLQFLATMFGVHRAGLVWVPINIGLSDDDVRYILEHSESRFVVVDAALVARPGLASLLAATPGRGWVLEGPAQAGFGAFTQALSQQSAVEQEVEIHDRDVAQIMYTSGTTGRPKGVMQSHLAVVMAAMNNAVECGLWRDAVCNASLPLFIAPSTRWCAGCWQQAVRIVTKGF